jgi:hypothetical protein
MLQKSCAKFKTHMQKVVRQSSSTVKMSLQLSNNKLKQNKNKDLKDSKAEKPAEKSELGEYLSKVEYVDLTDLLIEKIVRSPVQLLHRQEIAKIHERNARAAQRTRESIQARIQDLSSHQLAFQFLATRRINEEVHEVVSQMIHKGEIDESLGELIQENIQIDPDDMTDIDSFPVYPGSPNGPHPEDDPQFYSSWAINNMPPYIRRLKGFLDAIFGHRLKTNKKLMTTQSQPITNRRMETGLPLVVSSGTI